MNQAPDMRPTASPPPAGPVDGGDTRGRSAREPESGDYRESLQSRRWDAAPLRNPEVEKTDPRIAVAAIVLLCAITLVVLVAGYASGFWTLPT
jgi:hypothetical protein